MLRVAVVQGGPSSEAAVSRASAKGVASALKAVGHEAIRLELNDHLAESLRTGGYDVVFPVVHGQVGEDGSLQGLLEVLGLAYVGANVLASAIAMDKPTAKKLLAAAGIPVPRGIALARASDARAAAEQAKSQVGPALVVKPAANGSAIGVARLEDLASIGELAAAIEAVWKIDDVALVETFLRGREVTCGVLDLAGAPKALPPTEIASPNDAFYTYSARYAPGRSLHTCPAELGEAITTRVQELAVAAHRALGVRDLSRVDFVVGRTVDDVTVLELNTMPGFTATSLYPEAAAVSGLAFPALCDAFVKQAAERGSTRRNEPMPFPG
ncbi:MAG: D-alanine--D-alanine ligase [Polyangiaceae bacterium]